MGIINTKCSRLQFNKLKPFILLLIELVFIICVILFDEHNMVKICFSFLAIIRLLLEKSFVKHKNEYNVFYITVIYCYFVYSTFNGMSNWLGTAFYSSFKATIFPFGWILLSISIGYIFLVWKLMKTHVKPKELLTIMAIAFAVDLSIWYPVSFESYYSGVELKNKEVSKLMFNNSKLILESDKSEKEKIEALEEIFGNYIWARLYKNNSIYFKTSFTRPNIDTLVAEEKFDTNKRFKIGKDEYIYSDILLNRPEYKSGISKAVTWSLFPYSESDPGSNYVYIKRQRAGRSMNLWIIFSALYSLMIISLYMVNKKKEELEKIENKLKNQYSNTGLYQELLFEQLSNEMNDVVASTAKAHMQKFVSELKGDKLVYTDKGLNATMDSIKESIGSKIHDYKNQWAIKETSDCTDGAYENRENHIVDTILKDLESLKTVFDVSYSNYTVLEVEKIIYSSLSRQYREAPESEFKYQYLIKDKKIENMLVSINKYRLKSIIVNLLQNSDKAILRHKFSISKKEREKYRRHMALTLNTEIYEGKQYFTICLEDNGGGFAKPDKIYYEPIESSDLSRGKRMGSGTIYVGMFVHRMNGIIKAYNKIMSDGNIGACTKILLPLKEAKKDV